MDEYKKSLKEDWEDALVNYKEAKQGEIEARIEITSCLVKLHALHDLIVKELK